MIGNCIFRGCPDNNEPVGIQHSICKTAFLDRDGVLNVDQGYVNRIEDFKWIDGAIESIELLKTSGFRVVVVTNQSGIGRGLYTEDDFLQLTTWMLEQTRIDAVIYCPHAPEANCPARKPCPGMLQFVDEHYGVDMNQSFLIGDKPTDLLAAESFGILGMRFSSGNLQEFIDLRLSL